MKSRRRKFGFTLAELLVVIAIILLIALLLKKPAFAVGLHARAYLNVIAHLKFSCWSCALVSEPNRVRAFTAFDGSLCLASDFTSLLSFCQQRLVDCLVQGTALSIA